MTGQVHKSFRLAIVRSRYNPYGGAERFVERTLQALQGGARGQLTVSLIARQWDTPEALEARQLIACKPFYIGRLWRDWSFARGVQRLMAQENFDLVQSHERIAGCQVYRAGDGVHATWLSLRAQGLSSLQRLGQRLSPWHRYTLAAEDALFRDTRLQAVICNAQMVRDDLARRYPALAERLFVLYNGVDLQRFSPDLRAQYRVAWRQKLGIAETTPVILYVGSGFARKGLGPLLAALKQPALGDARLWVVGKDKAQARFEKQAMQLGVADRVHFAGPQKDVLPWLGAADAFALPTLYDPQPNAALEALASGLPVLCSDQCGTAELLTDPLAGRVCGATDVAAIAQHLADLLAAGEAARVAARRAVAHLSLEAMAAQQLALYQRLMGLTDTRLTDK